LVIVYKGAHVTGNWGKRDGVLSREHLVILVGNGQRGDIEDIVKKYEKDEMKRRIYQPGLIPRSWRGEMNKFTENEFESKAKIGDKLESTTSDEINEKYHEDKFDPIDGEIIEAADNLAAFLEAYLAIQNGIVTSEFERAICIFKEKYKDEEKTIAGLNFKEIYIDF